MAAWVGWTMLHHVDGLGSEPPTSFPTAQPSYPNYHANLTSFDFDRSIGSLTLYFNDIVDVSTLNISQLELHGHKHPGPSDPHSFSLTGVYNSLLKQGNSTSAKLFLLADDYARLILYPEKLFTSTADSFITLEDTAILTKYKERCYGVPRSLNDSLQVNNFHNDTLPPFLSYYSLNMNSGVLSMTFSEPILLQTFTVEGLALQGSRNVKMASSPDRAQYQTLAQDDLVAVQGLSNYNRTVDVQLGRDNLNNIKRQVGLATSFDSTFLSASKSFVDDTSNNPISLVAFDYLNAVSPQSFTPDSMPPELMYWDFDMATGGFTLYFTETLYMSFFNYSGVQLTDGNGTFMRLEHPLNATSANSDIVRFWLNIEQLELVQADSNFFTYKNTTFLALDQGIVVDTSAAQNLYSSALATEVSPMRVRNYQRDTVKPQLASFSLDMMQQVLVLEFTKSVRRNSLNVKYLSLQSAQDFIIGTESISLQSTDVTMLSTKDGPKLELQLSNDIVKILRTFFYLGKSTDYTFIAINYRLVTDCAKFPNTVVDISTGQALQASNITADTYPPQLVAWTMNLDLNYLVLNFSKAVDLSTLNVSDATLYSDSFLLPSTASLPLHQAVSLHGYSGRTLSVVISLSSSQVISIKSNPNLCTSAANCFLSLTANFIRMMDSFSTSGSINYLSIDAASFVSCSLYINDAIAPVVHNFTLDMSLRQLTLEFNKPMNGLNSNFSQLTLSADAHDHRNLTTALSPYSFVQNVIDLNVTIHLSLLDFCHIQLISPAATSINTTFIHVGSEAIQDTAGNYAKAVTLESSGFIPDLVRPTLLAVYLENGSYANITLYFSEIIHVPSLKTSAFTIMSRGSSRYTLGGALVTSVGDNAQSVVLDLSPLKATLTGAGIAVNQSTTFVYLSSPAAITDISPNHNNATTMPAAAALRDGITFIGFRLDILRGIMFLDLPMNRVIKSIRPSSFTIRSANGNGAVSLSSTNTTFIQRHQNMLLEIYISSNDRVSVLQYVNLTSAVTVQLSIAVNAITDESNKELSAALTLACDNLIKDSTQPVLISFTLDLSGGYLTLYFSKAINTATLNFSGNLQLQNAVSSPSATFVLVNAVLMSSSSSITDTLTLDLNVGTTISTREELLLAYPIGSSTSSTYLSARKGLVYDNLSPANPSAEISSSDALRASKVTLDTVVPSLTSYTLDLTTLVMTLSFSEAVNVTALRVNQLTLGSSLSSPSANYTLSTTSVALAYSPTNSVQIKISDYDYNKMLALAPDLALTSSETFLSFPAATFRDLANPPNYNTLVLYRYGIAISVNSFVPDSTPPYLEQFNVSMSTGEVDMLFNKVVNCRTFQGSKVFFQQRAFVGVKNSGNIFLSDSSYCTGSHYSKTLKIIVDGNDLNRIKADDGVLKSRDTSFIGFTAGAFYDAFNNANLATVDGYAIEATSYTADVKAPSLLAVSISSVAIMTLFFTEPMRIESIQVQHFWFQNAETDFTSQFPLINTRLFRTDSLRTVLEFELNDDFDRIAASSNIFDTQSLTFFRADSHAITDAAGNYLNAIPANRAMQVGPSILYWDLNLNTNYLYLGFSDTINSVFSLNGLVIQSNRSAATSNISLALVSSNSAVQSGASSTYYAYQLSFTDLAQIKTSGIVASAGSVPYSLFLAAAAGITYSTAKSNFLPNLHTVAINSSTALQVRYFTPDTSPSMLDSFDLDLYSDTVTLNFNEPVDVPSLIVTGITLVSSVTGNLFTITAANSTLQSLSQGSQIRIYLTDHDAAHVKLAYYYGSQLDNLILAAGAVKDNSGNVFGGNINNPAPLGSLTPDTKPADIVRYAVDLSSYVLYLTYDDVVLPANILLENVYLVSNASLQPSTSHALQLSNYTLVSQGSGLRTVMLDLGFLRHDQYALEAKTSIYNSINDSFIALLHARDLLGNLANHTIFKQAATFTPHDTAVQLESFDFQFISAGTIVELSLYFSNTLNISKFYCADFLLQSAQSASPTYVKSLQQSDCTLLTTTNSHVVSFTVPSSLFPASALIGVTEAETWMSVSNSSSSRSVDIYGNTIQLISETSALRVGPRILRVSLDLSTGVVIMVFSKNIEVASMTNVSSISFYSDVTGSSYMLLSSNSSSSSILLGYGAPSALNDSVVTLQLSTKDLSRIKQLQPEAGHLYLDLATDAVKDLLAVGNPAVSNKQLSVSRLLPDTINPVVVGFEINMGTETISIQVRICYR